MGILKECPGAAVPVTAAGRRPQRGRTRSRTSAGHFHPVPDTLNDFMLRRMNPVRLFDISSKL